MDADRSASRKGPFVRRPGEPLGTHQRLSLRSLAFILCSAIRRARALSCAALPSLLTEIAGENLGKWPRTCLQKWRWRSYACAVSCEHYKPPRTISMGFPSQMRPNRHASSLRSRGGLGNSIEPCTSSGRITAHPEVDYPKTGVMYELPAIRPDFENRHLSGSISALP